MAKRIAVALAIVLIVGVGLFVWMRGDLLRNDETGGMIGQEPQAVTQAAAPGQNQQRQVPAQEGEADGGKGAESIPLEMLDGALESATAQIEVPEGIQSSQIPEDNGLHWFLIAVEQMPKLDDWYDEVRDDYIDNGWRDDARMIEILDRCQASFEAIRKGIEVGNVDFPPAGLDEPLPYLAKWRELTRLMTIQGMMYSSRGDYDAALDQLTAVVDFGSESSRGGFLITHLVGNAMQGIGARQLCKVLQAPGLSAEQCRAVAAHLDALEPKVPRMADAIRAEADSLEVWFQRRSSSPDFYNDFLEIFVPAAGESGKAFAESATPEQCRELYEQMVVATRQAAPLFEAPVYEFDDAAFQALIAGNILSERIMEAYLRMPKAEALSRVVRTGTSLVAAIEAYRHEEGAYPQTLQSLVPSVLPELPSDPFTGQPFRYARQSGAYRLYSAGINMRDDGGTGKGWDTRQDDYILVGGAK
ncbi:MAG: hypothetical protein NTZ09_00340 [Candidatus Hydrogenedentes bacterium]|nr:hypothetical protein [Candidatus Hydrogenedentota bacterium]